MYVHVCRIICEEKNKMNEQYDIKYQRAIDQQYNVYTQHCTHRHLVQANIHGNQEAIQINTCGRYNKEQGALKTLFAKI